MYYISHRGNLNGINTERENSPDYIQEAIDKGFHIEVDIWFVNNAFYFGHDEPTYKIKSFENNIELQKYWFHCKNIESLIRLNDIYEFTITNYFWHQNDYYTLTSCNYIWTYPGQKLTKKSICVLPENSNYSKNELKNCIGICSNYIENYQNITYQLL